MPTEATLIIGNESPELRTLAAALDAELLSLPETGDEPGIDWDWAPALEQWRTQCINTRPRRGRIVVAVWPPQHRPGAVQDTDPGQWAARCEAPVAAWFSALGCAQALCADGGSIVAVVEAPGSLDCVGWGPEMAVAEAVVALVKSLARSEGARQVRANAVTTPWRVSTAECVAPAPPLASFPGTLDAEVAGAVRLLLNDEARGLTGTVLRADCGRSWV